MLDEEEIFNLSNVIRSGQISQGDEVLGFEEMMTEFIGLKGAVATNSGTSALHLALLSLNIRDDDEVAIPSYTCTAILNAINYVNATPLLVDIDPDTFNIDLNDLKRKVTKRTKAVIVPHMFGLPADIEDIVTLGIPVIEDCAQAIGATYNERRIGGFGYISIYSFYATKVITTGEGGMILSDSKRVLEKVRDLREYDKKDIYLPGFNYKMTDIQAALGISQLNKLPLFLDRRTDIADRYTQSFKDIPITLPGWYSDRRHIFYRFVIKTRDNSDKYFRLLEGNDVSCQRPVYLPLHNYLKLDGFPGTDDAWNKAISIPIYPALSDDEIKMTIDVVRDVFSKNEKPQRHKGHKEN